MQVVRRVGVVCRWGEGGTGLPPADGEGKREGKSTPDEGEGGGGGRSRKKKKKKGVFRFGHRGPNFIFGG